MAPLTRSRADEAAGDLPGSDINVALLPPAQQCRADHQRRHARLAHRQGLPRHAGASTPTRRWKAGRPSPRPCTRPARASSRRSGMSAASPTPTSSAAPRPWPPRPSPRICRSTRPRASRTPRCRTPLTVPEIAEIVEQFPPRARPTRSARAFDGVEIHGANGLPDRPVSCATAPTSAPMPTAARSKNRVRFCPRRGGTPWWPKIGKGPRRHPPVSGEPGQRLVGQPAASGVRPPGARARPARHRPSSTSSKAPPVARATCRASTSLPHAAPSAAATSPTTATTGRWPWTRWPSGRGGCSRLRPRLPRQTPTW